MWVYSLDISGLQHVDGLINPASKHQQFTKEHG